MMRTDFAVIGKIVQKEFYQIRQDKRMLGVSFVAPFVMLLLLGYAATTDIKNSNLVVCDLDKTAESRAFINQFTTSGYFIERYAVDHPGDINYFIEHAEASVGLVVPVGFGRKMLSHETSQVQMILDGTDANTANILLTYATQIIVSYSQSILMESTSIVRGVSIGRIVPVPRIWFNPDLQSSHFMVPGVVAMVLMIITMTLT